MTSASHDVSGSSASDATVTDCSKNRRAPSYCRSSRSRPSPKDSTKLHYRETTLRRVIKVPVDGDVSVGADLRSSLDRVLNSKPMPAQSRFSCQLRPDEYRPATVQHEAPVLFKAFHSQQFEIVHCVSQHNSPLESQLMVAPRGPFKTRLIEPLYFQLINHFANCPQRAIVVKLTKMVRQPVHLLRADEHCAVKSLIVMTVSVVIQFKETIASASPIVLQLMNVEPDEPVTVTKVLIDDDDDDPEEMTIKLPSSVEYSTNATAASNSSFGSSQQLFDQFSAISIKNLQVMRSGTNEDVDRRTKCNSNRRRIKHDSERSETAQKALGDVVEFMSGFVKDMGEIAKRRSMSTVSAGHAGNRSHMEAGTRPEDSVSVVKDEARKMTGRRRKVVYDIASINNEQSSKTNPASERKTLRARRRSSKVDK